MSLPKLLIKNILKKKKQSRFQENKEYFNKWAHTYDKYLFRWFMKRAQQKSIDLIDKMNFSALEVGCGTGEGLLMLKEATNGKIVGIDISDEMLKRARNKLKGKNINVKKANVENIPYNNETFDAVLSTESFHHYVNPRKAINEMKRVLKKGGNLIITDANFYLPLFNKIMEKIEPGIVHIYNKKEMKKIFIQAGLKNIKQKRTAFAFFITKGVK